MAMTKGERDQLLQLVKKREKVMKVKAQERSATLLAEFDAQSAKIYHWDEDAVWASVKAEAEKAIAEAKLAIAARCSELGIPVEFAPGLAQTVLILTLRGTMRAPKRFSISFAAH